MTAYRRMIISRVILGILALLFLYLCFTLHVHGTGLIFGRGDHLLGLVIIDILIIAATVVGSIAALFGLAHLVTWAFPTREIRERARCEYRVARANTKAAQSRERNG